MGRVFLLVIFLTLSLAANANGDVAADSYLADVEQSLETIKLNKVKVKDLFAKNHAGTRYKPVKLEASISQPVFYNLGEIISHAVENNLNYLISQEQNKEAKWKLWSKYADMLPDFSLNAQTRNVDGTFYLNSSVQAPIDERVSSAGMRLNYRAFDGGTTSFLALAERFYKKSSDELMKDQFNKVILDSMSLYFDMVSAQSNLSAKLHALEQAKANMDLAEKYFKAGTGTKFDVIQAEARLARAQQGLVTAETGYRISQINLTEHLNLPLLTPINIAFDEVQNFKLIDESMKIDEFLQISHEKNPRIKSRLNLRKGAVKEGLSKVGAFLPDVDLYADFSGTGEEFSDLFGVTTMGVQLDYQIGKGLGVSHVAEVMKAKAQVEQAKLEYEKEKISIEKDLRLAFIQYQESKSLLQAANLELSAAKESLRISRLRYENGIEIFSNLVEKEAELADAEQSLIDSLTSYNLAQLRLLYEMGDIQIEKLITQN